MFRNQVRIQPLEFLWVALLCEALKDARVSQYDQDVVTWSPQGRIHQIEYAMEAVKQGSAAVGLKVCFI